MYKDRENKRPSGSERRNEPKAIRDVFNEYLASDQPLAQQLRDELFRSLHPNTELDVDLKLLTRRPGRLAVGERLRGVIERDGDEHFTFAENASEREIAQADSTDQPLTTAPADSAPARIESQPQLVRRYPKVFAGRTINVTRMDDGTLRPSLKRPPYGRDYTFLDFCLEAANELEQVGYCFDDAGRGGALSE